MVINELKRMIESGELPAPSTPISDEISTLSIAEREDLAQSLWRDLSIRRGARVTLRKSLPPIYTVISIKGDKALCMSKNGTEAVEFNLSELVRI